MLIAMPSIQAKEFGSSAMLALAIGIPLMVLFSLTAGLISLCLTHFVVPIMYLRRIGVMAAWDEFRHELLADRVGTFVLYVLFQIVIGIAIGVLALLATCLTCCYHRALSGLGDPATAVRFRAFVPSLFSRAVRHRMDILQG